MTNRIYEESDFIDLADFLESADVDEIGSMLRFAAMREKQIGYAIEHLKEIERLVHSGSDIYDNAFAALLALNSHKVKVSPCGVSND